MNELIKINYESDRPTVLARDLHEFLEVKTAYKDWFPRMCEYGFTEGEDFNPLKNERVQIEGSRAVSRVMDDAQLTIDMAKEICMLQRNEKGKQARQYFLQLEKEWNSPEAVMARALRMAQAKLERVMSSNWEINAETLIPKDCKKITIDFSELSAALERVYVLAQSGLQPVKIASTENEMILSMKTAIGSSMDSVHCKSEADIKLGVNAQYLARVLKAAKMDSFFVSSPVSPIVFKDTESIYILLPVRLRGE